MELIERFVVATPYHKRITLENPAATQRIQESARDGKIQNSAVGRVRLSMLNNEQKHVRVEIEEVYHAVELQ